MWERFSVNLAVARAVGRVAEYLFEPRGRGRLVSSCEADSSPVKKTQAYPPRAWGQDEESPSESRSVVSDSLQPHGLVRGILQARILERVAFPFVTGSSQPRD